MEITTILPIILVIVMFVFESIDFGWANDELKAQKYSMFSRTLESLLQKALNKDKEKEQ